MIVTIEIAVTQYAYRVLCIRIEGAEVSLKDIPKILESRMWLSIIILLRIFLIRKSQMRLF